MVPHPAHSSGAEGNRRKGHYAVTKVSPFRAAAMAPQLCEQKDDSDSTRRLCSEATLREAKRREAKHSATRDEAT